MKAFDVNRSWKAPIGCELRGVYAEGAYLRHEFHQRVLHADNTAQAGFLFTDVFVNDMGREVTRCTRFVPDWTPPTWTPLTRWEKIKNAFWNLIDVLFNI